MFKSSLNIIRFSLQRSIHNVVAEIRTSSDPHTAYYKVDQAMINPQCCSRNQNKQWSTHGIPEGRSRYDQSTML
jgi:hypothetical protein